MGGAFDNTFRLELNIFGEMIWSVKQPGRIACADNRGHLNKSDYSKNPFQSHDLALLIHKPDSILFPMCFCGTGHGLPGFTGWLAKDTVVSLP